MPETPREQFDPPQEPKTEADLNQTEEARELAKGWSEIESAYEKAEETHEREANSEVKSPSLEKLKQVIDTNFPEPNFLEIVAKQGGIEVDQLDEEQKGYAEVLKGEYLRNKNNLIELFSTSQIPDSEIEGYSQRILEFAEKTFPSQEKISLNDFYYRTKTLVEASDSQEKIDVYEDLLRQWKEELVDGAEDPTAKKVRMGDFNNALSKISQVNVYPRRTTSLETVKDRSKSFLEAYKYKYTVQDQFPSTPNSKEINIGSFMASVENLAIANSDPEQVKRLIELFDENRGLDKITLRKIVSSATRYGTHHGLSETAKVGFEQNIIPAIQEKNPQVDVLQKESNVWAMKAGEFGLGDFVCHAYCSEVNPKNINRLLMALREVPTTSHAKLEQNRKDGLLMASPFGALRDFIHDQRPMVREVVNAMVKYYETKDPAELKSVLSQTDYLSSEERTNAILDLTRYDNDTQERDTKNPIKVIDVLRRLAQNTQVVEEKPKETSDKKLNKALEKLADDVNDKNIESSLEAVNKLLEEAIQEKQVGIEPNMISAIAFVERKLFGVLQSMDYETQQSFYKKSWFKDLLKFQEFTTSLDYNSEEFDQFLKEVKSCKTSREAYQLVGDRVLDHVYYLSKSYSVAGRKDLSGALWSGNVTHEMIGISTPKPASTVYGAKHREEQMTPLWLRNTGD